MPIYEYKCDNGHVFDVVQRMTDEALTECQVCGAPAVRVLHSPAVHFKGSGFYNTDYGKKKGSGAPGEGGAESKPSDSSESSESSSSDSKPSDAKSSDAKSSDSKPKAASTD
jgi:putative FmdB family regulatory protein